MLQPLADDCAAQVITGICKAVWAPNSALAYASDLDSRWRELDGPPFWSTISPGSIPCPSFLPAHLEMAGGCLVVRRPSFAYIAHLGDSAFDLQRVDVVIGGGEAVAAVEEGVLISLVVIRER